MREGYVMALLNAVDEYVQAIQEKGTSRRYSTTDTGLAVDAAYASPRASSSTSSIMVSKPQMYPRTRAAGLR